VGVYDSMQSDKEEVVGVFVRFRAASFIMMMVMFSIVLMFLHEHEEASYV
jgi:hypothetical protein